MIEVAFDEAWPLEQGNLERMRPGARPASLARGRPASSDVVSLEQGNLERKHLSTRRPNPNQPWLTTVSMMVAGVIGERRRRFLEDIINIHNHYWGWPQTPWRSCILHEVAAADGRGHAGASVHRPCRAMDRPDLGDFKVFCPDQSNF